MTHRPHLAEEKLFDCYLAEHSGDLVDPPSAEHLADCSACAARYAELAAFMDGLRQGGIAEADALFTPDRLRLQQQQIARRLEQVGRPARVISFPTRLVRRTMSGSPSHGVPRWVAAAVAAGLFVGVAVGAGYQYETHARAAAHMLARQTTVHPLTPIAKRGDAPAQLAADDAFLSDLEVALERPHTRELMAYDALTPHVRDVSNPR